MPILETVNPAFLIPVLDLLSDSIVWVHPVFTSSNEVEDFEVTYSNRSADESTMHPYGSITGLRIRRDGVPSIDSAEASFQNYLHVYQSGEISETVFFAHHSGRTLEMVRRPYEGGVLSTMRDRRDQREAEMKEASVRRTLQSISESSPNGIVLYDAIRTQDGAISDFKIRYFNQRSNELTGLTTQQRETLTFREVLSLFGAESSITRYREVVETGVSFQREQFVQGLQTWIAGSVVKMEDGFLSMLYDITDLKRTQIALQQQSNYLNSILNASLNAVFTCEAVRDETGAIINLRYTQVNKMYETLIQKSEEEVVGHTMLELFPLAKSTGAFDIHCRVIETGIPARFDLRYEGDGLDAWFDTSAVKVGDNGVVITFADVLDQKKAVAQMEEQKNLLDNILKNSSNGISVSRVFRDENGKVVDALTIMANDAAVKFIGLPKDVYLSKRATEIEPNIIGSQYYQSCIKTLNTGEPFLTQYQMEATGRWLELTVSRMDESHLIQIFTDVTAVKEAQLQLETTVQALKRSNTHLENFAHAASHDMKEPLRKIRTFTDRLKSGMGERITEVESRMFNRIEVAAERMQLLVEDLLEFSQVSQKPRELETIDLNNKVQKVLADLELVIEEKSAQVNITSLPTIVGNRRQMQQLFYNLIGNALKYSKPGIAPEVNISSKLIMGQEAPTIIAKEQGDKLFHLIEISDNGIGFEPQYAERIFEMFQRLHGRTEYTGTGVGLPIARKVAENHNGYIWAEGRPGTGATFKVLMPAD